MGGGGGSQWSVINISERHSYFQGGESEEGVKITMGTYQLLGKFSEKHSYFQRGEGGRVDSDAECTVSSLYNFYRTIWKGRT